MKKIFCSLVILVGMCVTMSSFAADEFSCGAGYVLSSHSKIDGLNTMECKKLWCRDLETNRAMGSGDKVAAGYIDKKSSVTDGNETIDCFGDRKWCAGEGAGVWDYEVGAYVRGSDGGSTYKSVLKGNCFGWRLEKPECAAGESAILRDGEWICVTASSGDINNVQKSSVRRTGAVRRISR